MMSYFDKKIDVPSPGPLSIYVHTLQEQGYEKEVPNPMWVSRWLGEIFYSLLDWNDPFNNYEIHLWSQFRPDNPLQQNQNDRLLSGETRPGITLLNSIDYYGPDDVDSINFQRLLSHEFGHQYWFTLKMYDTAQKAPQQFYAKYLKMRNLLPQDKERNVEIWAEDFKYSCGSYKAQNSFDPKDIPSTEKIPGLTYYMQHCFRLIQWLMNTEQNNFTELTYTIHQDGTYCYWSWKHSNTPRFSWGDGYIYELQNNQWVKIGQQTTATPLPTIDILPLD